MNLAEAESFLNALPRFADAAGKAYQPGLERITRLLDEMGSPHERFDAVHVAGTNGKGSTASLIAAVGSAVGHRIGLHTSPHLFHVSERMRVNGKPAQGDWLAGAVGRFRDLADDVRPSFFEFTVALSLLYFADQEVDLAVVEVGMGGRLDATNIISPVLSVITDIGLDHTEHLGSTVEAIAAEKAGIIKPGVPVITSARPEPARVVEEVALRKNAPFHHVAGEVEVIEKALSIRGCTLTVRTPLRTYENLFIGLAGRHQISNAATALRSSEIVYDAIQSDARPVFEAMRHVRTLSGLRGRLEVLRDRPLIVADVGHNADGIAAALDHLTAMHPAGGRLLVLLGLMRDKDVEAVARRLAEAHARALPVEVPSERALPAAELAARLRGLGVQTDRPTTVAEGIRDFIGTADHHDALLITGSHLVVAQISEHAL